MSDEYYKYWEDFFRQWKAGAKAINGWTDPDSLPLYNSDKKDLSSLYVPEPWWGNDGNPRTPLHSVVINFNPGAGAAAQSINSINAQSFPSYANLVNSNYLKKTANWHFDRRAKPILTALNRGGYISNDDISLKSHLSIELIPWHSQSADKTYLKYCRQNLNNIFDCSIKFAADESRRIANTKLKNTVIIKMSGDRMTALLKGFESIKQCSSSSGICTAPSDNGCYMVFHFDSIPDIKFVCVWGKHSRNKFPDSADLDWIISKI